MVAIFDLDGTLTWRDTLLPYLLGYLRRHPLRWLCLWRAPLHALAFAAFHHNRGKLKSDMIRTVLSGARRDEVDAWSAAFVAGLPLHRRYRPAALAALDAHRTAGDHLVLLSASPDLYVPVIGRSLGFERTLCTELIWRDDRLEGSLKTANRRGEEKARCVDWLRTQYPGQIFAAYGNSASDLPHLRRVERALLVNGNAAARAAALHDGIPTAHWT